MTKRRSTAPTRSTISAYMDADQNVLTGLTEDQGGAQAFRRHKPAFRALAGWRAPGEYSPRQLIDDRLTLAVRASPIADLVDLALAAETKRLRSRSCRCRCKATSRAAVAVVRRHGAIGFLLSSASWFSSSSLRSDHRSPPRSARGRVAFGGSWPLVMGAVPGACPAWPGGTG